MNIMSYCICKGLVMLNAFFLLSHVIHIPKRDGYPKSKLSLHFMYISQEKDVNNFNFVF